MVLSDLRIGALEGMATTFFPELKDTQGGHNTIK